MDLGIAEAIKKAGWWQGSILPESSFNGEYPTGGDDGWWIITSQTCNLYNPNFTRIPVFELVAAKKIEKLDKSSSRGNNPRILHLEAMGDGETAFFEVDIQNRIWVKRAMLPNLGSPAYEVHDATRETDNWVNNQWLDTFAAWLSRSYTRVTLPDDFNNILRTSKIQSVLDSKLRDEGLYGIYFSISSASEDEWTGNLGLMPAPYFLEIMLVSDEEVDPEPLVKNLQSQLFTNNTKSVVNEKEVMTSKAAVAKSLGLTIISAGATGKNIAEISMLEVKSHIRYTLNDYLSQAGAEHI